MFELDLPNNWIWLLGLVLLALGVGWSIGSSIRGRRHRRILKRQTEQEAVALLKDLERRIFAGNLSNRLPVDSKSRSKEVVTQYNRVLDHLEGALAAPQRDRDQIQGAIIKLLEEVSDVGMGDLTVEAEVTGDATGALADSFNFMVSQLREIVVNVQSATLQVNNSVTTVQQTAEELAQQSELQTAQLGRATSTVNEMALSVQEVSKNATLSAQVAEQARRNSQEGTQAVQATIEGMNRIREQVQETAKRIKRLGESSQEIDEIIQVIREIAKRTSLLALNASLEAAAAGEAGRGFAVVAEDVKRLAARSTEATHQIAELVRTIQRETNAAISAMEDSTREVVDGSLLANEAGQSLAQIEGVSTQLATLIEEISQRSQGQAQDSDTVTKVMDEIAHITRKTANDTKAVAGSIDHLAELAINLRRSVSTFKLSEQSRPDYVDKAAVPSVG